MSGANAYIELASISEEELMTRRLISLAILVLSFAAFLPAQETVSIRVHAEESLGPFPTSWAYFGYDEPNYTDRASGKQLLSKLRSLAPVPVYIRMHNLLTSGDGKPALKWGSTNVYTEDASGRPVYDWKVVDSIFDALKETKTVPLVEIGFMPEALSVKPQPYRHTWPEGTLWTGWAHPPRDYDKWSELIHEWVRRAVERYGRAEVETWYWELWNEPDIGYWQGTPEEYHKLYDYTAAAAKRALPTARFGGPHTTGASSDRAAEFLRNFLEHCVRGKNYATGKTGSPLDYIAFHAKGRPTMVEGRVQMGLARQLADIDRGFAIIASFPELKHLPVVLGESDPEGCAACSARTHPQNAYRNGPLYAAYTAATYERTLELASRHGINLAGAVTWAFLFEDQPYFAGFRTLSTNGIDKPVLNFFRLIGLMGGNRVAVESSGAVKVDEVLASGVRGRPEINALASRREREVSLLVWNYHDDDVSAPAAPLEISFEGLPQDVRRALVRHYRVDSRTSNAYAVWQEMGSPQQPTPAQYARLEAAGHVQLLTSPEWVETESGRVRLRFELPRQGLSLVQLSW